jgi:hypothetical protein
MLLRVLVHSELATIEYFVELYRPSLFESNFDLGHCKLVPQFVLNVNVIYKTELENSHLSAQDCF